VSSGVVNIGVTAERGGMLGEGSGSGFLIDKAGHIVTNNHVVAGADLILVVFDDGTQVEAEVAGRDPHSDLAVIRARRLPEGVDPLPVGDSDRIRVGDSVVAIGSPFGLGNSMTTGIVSAVGRLIPSGATPFGIPQAIQTDAAINPGNSGGPLLDVRGEVIGVNAQIASGGVPANAGVGFAIPSNVVHRVAPVLMEAGTFDWPWLGVGGGSVDLLVMRANDLDAQRGAYIASVVEGGPADDAGLRGSTEVMRIRGIETPVGGDVVVAADGEPVQDFADLLVTVMNKNPGDSLPLTILRAGRRHEIQAVLGSRPSGR
jgi:2-alkenal reductase